MFKGTVRLISSDSLFIEWCVRFTTVLINPLMTNDGHISFIYRNPFIYLQKSFYLSTEILLFIYRNPFIYLQKFFYLSTEILKFNFSKWQKLYIISFKILKTALHIRGMYANSAVLNSHCTLAYILVLQNEILIRDKNTDHSKAL